MRAAVLRAYGSPALGEFAEPEASTPEQTVVEVLAAPINAVDRGIATGTHYLSPRKLPVVCGLEGVGRLPDGRRVHFTQPVAPYGSMAQRTVIDLTRAIQVPDGLDDATAATLGNAGWAAWLPLSWRAGMQPGEHVLILGATGVVGRLAVQAARLLGAGRVTAAGRDEAALAETLALGADAAIHIEDLASAGAAEVIVDYICGPPAAAALRAAATGVRLVQLGEGAGDRIDLPAAVLRAKAAAIYGFMNRHAGRDRQLAAYQAMAEHAITGRLTVSTEEHPLADVEHVWTAKSHNKLVLRP